VSSGVPVQRVRGAVARHTPILLLFIRLQRYFVEGIAVTGIK
jgi:ABC-type maltose transport system permease subunit